ncbi:hypothetical protein DBR47_00845 [Paucibacter sp. KBW04]|uniref:DUF935 domain-containing protein n=1 Tax=Paucibacter sp. KBW04 TaxID=2153361 RepID=UPI000F58D71E|nr:DUF935 family protein [Paucibacter sp. KBW04]RQO63153.1 hypothetical protein DBR47_00845 [Paucibacter sp. KBW04]
MILDKDGEPMTQEIASITRDPHRVFFGGVQFNEDDTIKARGGSKGLKIYQELKRDAHAGAVLAKRKLAVTSRTWVVNAASEKPADKAAAELVTKALQHLKFNNICKRLLEANLNGFQPSEILWEVRDGLVLPKTIKARDPRRFTFGLQDELRLLTRENLLQGEVMPARKFIVHRRGADDDSPFGAGLGSMLYWPVFFKRNGITFWLTFADKFGAPTALGKYPAGAQKDEQKKLLGALAAISRDAGVIIPEGMAIELIEASRSGSVDTYEKLVRYMDEQISKAVLGETMSTTAASAGLGSNQANVQNDVRLEVAMDDANELDETLNDTLVRWIVEYNMPGAGLPKLEHVFDEPEDTAKLAERDSKLFQMGFEPSEQYITETYGEGWTRKAPPSVLTAPVQTQGYAVDAALEAGAEDEDTRGARADDPATAGFAEGLPLGKASAQRAFNQARQEAIQSGAEELAAQWQALMRKPMEDLVNLLDETGDLVQFRERLTGLLHAKPDPATVETIARATFAGHVMGRGLAKPVAKKPGLMARAVKKLLGDQ